MPSDTTSRKELAHLRHFDAEKVCKRELERFSYGSHRV